MRTWFSRANIPDVGCFDPRIRFVSRFKIMLVPQPWNHAMSHSPLADDRYVPFMAETAKGEDARLPLPVAALLITTTSLGLWALIWKLAAGLLAW